MTPKHTTTWTCGLCGKECRAEDFRVSSLIHPDRWLCEDCAIREEREWLANLLNPPSAEQEA